MGYAALRTANPTYGFLMMPRLLDVQDDEPAAIAGAKALAPGDRPSRPRN